MDSQGERVSLEKSGCQEGQVAKELRGNPDHMTHHYLIQEKTGRLDLREILVSISFSYLKVMKMFEIKYIEISKN